MLKRAVVAAVATLALAFGATASAEKPHDTVTGTWTYVPVTVSFDKTVGQQVFFSGTTADVFDGAFAGTGDQQFTGVHHANQEFNFYRGVTEFDGTVEVDGVLREGTMTILTVGKQDPGLVLPSEFPWDGTWVITDAAGGLDGLHGHGTFTGPSGFLTYHGTIHFTK